jgi:hypothetical protein
MLLLLTPPLPPAAAVTVWTMLTFPLLIMTGVTVEVCTDAKAPTLGKSAKLMSPRSSYKLCEKESVPMSRSVDDESGTEAANWNRCSAPVSSVMVFMSGGLSRSVAELA